MDRIEIDKNDLVEKLSERINNTETIEKIQQLEVKEEELEAKDKALEEGSKKLTE